jgi:hypothetical protein
VLTGVAQRTTGTLTVVMPNATFARTDAEVSRLKMYHSLAAETGGSVIPSTADLTATFRSVLDEFRSTYVLHFTPQGVARPGFHTLDVKVSRTAAIVRARRGYVGG